MNLAFSGYMRAKLCTGSHSQDGRLALLDKSTLSASHHICQSMKPLYNKGDQILLKVPTVSGWQGIGVLLDDIYDSETFDGSSIVAFHKQGDDSDSVPCIAVLSEIAPLLPSLPDFAEPYRQDLQFWWEKRKRQHRGSAKNEISCRTILALKKARDLGVLKEFCALVSERPWLTLGFAGYTQALQNLHSVK
jgi:hypothetical protein